jgi:hypothetical protein
MASNFETGHSGRQPPWADTENQAQEDIAMEVKAKTPITDTITQLTLVRADGRDLPAWTPGSHVDLVLGPDMVRQYSLCGEPGDLRSWQVSVLYEPDGRGGSDASITNCAKAKASPFGGHATTSTSSKRPGICSSPEESESPRSSR